MGVAVRGTGRCAPWRRPSATRVGRQEGLDVTDGAGGLGAAGVSVRVGPDPGAGRSAAVTLRGAAVRLQLGTAHHQGESGSARRGTLIRHRRGGSDSLDRMVWLWAA